MNAANKVSTTKVLALQKAYRALSPLQSFSLTVLQVSEIEGGPSFRVFANGGIA